MLDLMANLAIPVIMLIIIVYGKYKKVDVVKIKDNTSKKNHISYGFINKNKFLFLNLVEKIKR